MLLGWCKNNFSTAPDWRSLDGRQNIAWGYLIRPIVVAFSVAICFCPQPAYAYLDPGTGSMLVQGIVAAIAAVSSVLFVLRARLRQFFDRLLGRRPPGDGKNGESSSGISDD